MWEVGTPWLASNSVSSLIGSAAIEDRESPNIGMANSISSITAQRTLVAVYERK
jgi:hypothetical protein